MIPALFRIDPQDSTATALRDLEAGEEALGVTLAEPVAKGHKVAVKPIAAGEPVLKFGFPIGVATRAIQPGEHVHTHNVSTALKGSGDYAFVPSEPAEVAFEGPGFLGYRRANGRVGTRNEIWVIPTVGCVARTAQKIAERADRLHAGKIDGVHAFPHPFGCSQLGDDLQGTRAILSALANHPNAGGVLIVGLGCENNQIKGMLEGIDHPNLRTLGAQMASDEVEEGLALIEELVEGARATRTPAPLSELVLGVKCGGSDGFSGLTANPLVGRMADAVTRAGGTAILTEIPEIFGAEQLLMARAQDEAVFDGIVHLVNDFKDYFVRHGEPVSENPSPGNIAGGITTLEEKSLGAVQKAGHATVTDVIPYGGRVRRKGLTLLEAPGNDAVSSTALAAAGATAILFTTGRGTPLGFPVPTIKIASNSDLATRKPGWIDFDAGQVLDQGMEPAADALLDTIAAIASGKETAAERNGEREIAIWKRGVTL
ncbi:altronate dehydratase family protein [Sphingomonas sp. HITSZ_GF]|uniref:UxaA family hydrolase n=1 Tax=Sphingomonas sp. HITSZ_GF TaxID=3037247 RepID=UPI00240DE9BD|nr:altronate dehydratase family protein [Sphingomonas sp. HITSZ_GF]MDG2532538.1 altronate dehydratase family protein [Sphingomonas sp. HITSZ_GF]